MRAEESAYWDNIYEKQRPGGGFSDNIWKRQEIVRRILGFDLIGKTILEIGTGLGTTFASINAVLLGNIKYIGTDVSREYCEHNKKHYRMRVEHTDITALPVGDGEAELVFALDSLEHVRPEDRVAGNAEISRVLGCPGKLIIHLGMEHSWHDKRFDHPYGEHEVMDLMEACKLTMVQHDVYTINIRGNDRKHLWVVGERS